jgi:predicted transcriptional regulator
VNQRRGEPNGVFGPLEAEVMRAVWEIGKPVTVRELLKRLNAHGREPLAYTTVMTVMSRLAEKGALERRRDGRAYLYEAAVDDAAALAVRGVMREFGSSALAHFIGEARRDPKLRRRLARLLDDEQ